MTPDEILQRMVLACSWKNFNTEQHGQACSGFLVSSRVTLWLPAAAECGAGAGTARRAPAAARGELRFCRRSATSTAGIPPSPERTPSHTRVLLWRLHTSQDFNPTSHILIPAETPSTTASDRGSGRRAGEAFHAPSGLSPHTRGPGPVRAGPRRTKAAGGGEA